MTLLALPLLAAAQPASGAEFANPMAPPDPAVVAEARAILSAMAGSPRGPYERLRWYCNDGTVQPPDAFACRDRGGGRQHGEYSPARTRLAELGWHVGTVVAALSFEELWDAGRAQGRLRELPLESYLIDTRDGWVMRRARYYRGHKQAEDEEAAGRALLQALLEERRWAGENFLLLRETARALPHGAAGDRGRELRRLAQSVAERETTFEPLRVEIHGRPSAATAARVRSWVESHRARDAVDAGLLSDAERVAVLLTESYDAGGRRARLAETNRGLARRPGLADLSRQIAELLRVSARERLSQLAELTLDVRGRILSELRPADRLLLLDLLADLELEARVTAAEQLDAAAALTRGQRLAAARNLVDVAHATGFLSAGESRALASQLTAAAVTELPLEDYRQLLESLTLALGWAAGSVRHAFAEALVRYTALEPGAARFVDDLLRGSVMLSLADALQPLFNDVQSLSGVRRMIDGVPASGLVALNPGYATGRLRIFADDDEVEAARTDIVLLGQTTAELPPVAGLLTRGAGNLLSHVQLLARNFGIPNVAVGEREAERLTALSGREVEVIAGSDGSVLIRPAAAKVETPAGTDEPVVLTVPVPDLTAIHPLPLAELSRALSGRVVGPKAANLGELNRLFPGRVAPAVALPFGVFAAHAGAGPGSPLARLAEVYAAKRRGELSGQALADALGSIRQAIAAIELSDSLLDELLPMLAREFGEPDGYGLFVRSDTNVEDLPGFTGAGLNETVPNVRGLASQLATVPRVWASVLSPRAIAWRSDLLTNPADVYASVLLMKSVPADKSGVLVTADLAGRARGLTVSTAWGVGGAVAGEAAETLTLLHDDGERLISEAKAPFQRFLADRGGVLWHRAPDGPVLAADEKLALRALAGEVAGKYEPVAAADGRPLPWDIEFGFVGGELTLFQIRPLVERGQRRADRALVAVLGPARPAVDMVPLDQIVPPPDTGARQSGSSR